MMQRILPITVLLAALSGCGSARAASADAGNDEHCSLLTSQLASTAERAGLPADEKRAVGTIHLWYAAKLRETGAPAASLDAQGQSILEAMRRDPQSMRGVILGCTERAVRDPAFEAFESNHG